MDTETMIRELESVEEKHKHDKVFTGQINIATMAHDVRKRLEELKPYEDTGLTPDQIEGLKERMNDGWIPVEERLPEDGTYLCTLDGELCGIEEPFTGMCGIENGIWDEPDCVIAWRHLPEPYRPERSDNNDGE